MTCRRRSSQYSLFPNCSSPPSESNHTNVDSPRRQSSESSRTSRKSADLPLRNSPATTNEKSDNTIDPVSKQQLKQSDEMVRLIPLKLEAAPVTTKSHTNPPSSPPFLSKNSLITSFTLPEEREPASPRLSKRPRPGPVTELTILPYTLGEWKTVMEEVKNLYSKGQYKHCSMRCKQILDGIKDPVSIFTL